MNTKQVAHSVGTRRIVLGSWHQKYIEAAHILTLVADGKLELIPQSSGRQFTLEELQRSIERGRPLWITYGDCLRAYLNLDPESSTITVTVHEGDMVDGSPTSLRYSATVGGDFWEVPSVVTAVEQALEHFAAEEFEKAEDARKAAAIAQIKDSIMKGTYHAVAD